MSMEGYILLHRRVLAHYAFENERMSKREAWIWLLLQASYSPHKTLYKGKIITVDRGQIPTSFRKLSEEWKWSHNTVGAYLARLEQEGMLTQKTDHGFLVITICNYERYQNTKKLTDTHPDQTLTTDCPVTDTNIIKGNKNKEKKEGIQIPDWIPSEEWNQYVEMRIHEKKALNGNTTAIAIRKLTKLRMEGNDPRLVLEQSVFNSWIGLFPLKENKSNHGYSANQPAKQHVRTL